MIFANSNNILYIIILFISKAKPLRWQKIAHIGLKNKIFLFIRNGLQKSSIQSCGKKHKPLYRYAESYIEKFFLKFISISKLN